MYLTAPVGEWDQTRRGGCEGACVCLVCREVKQREGKGGGDAGGGEAGEDWRPYLWWHNGVSRVGRVIYEERHIWRVERRCEFGDTMIRRRLTCSEKTNGSLPAR